MSFAIRSNTNLKIELIQALLPCLAKPFSVISDAIYLIFLLVMLEPAFSAFMAIVHSNQTSPAVYLPMWVVYLSFLVGICLSLLRLLQKYVMPIITILKSTVKG
jgi:TRAP-type C4-dicarboxylate transport system permease small subunit